MSDKTHSKSKTSENDQQANDAKQLSAPKYYDPSWACLSHNPTTWCFGEIKNRRVKSVYATVELMKSGEWLWKNYINFTEGVEPSRKLAMLEVEIRKYLA